MLYLFRCRRLVSQVIPLKKGKPLIDYYYQGKVFFYLGVSFNLTRAYFPARKKNIKINKPRLYPYIPYIK